MVVVNCLLFSMGDCGASHLNYMTLYVLGRTSITYAVDSLSNDLTERHYKIIQFDYREHTWCCDIAEMGCQTQPGKAQPL